MRRNSVNSASV